MSQSQEKSRRFEVFTIHEYVQERQIRTSWLRVGSAWENADGSFNLRLNALPVTNTKTGTADLHMRLPRPKEEAPDATRAQAAPRPTQYEEEYDNYTAIDPISGIPVDEL